MCVGADVAGPCAAQVYSFAVVMWSLMTGDQPHHGMNTMQVPHPLPGRPLMLLRSVPLHPRPASQTCPMSCCLLAMWTLPLRRFGAPQLPHPPGAGAVQCGEQGDEAAGARHHARPLPCPDGGLLVAARRGQVRLVWVVHMMRGCETCLQPAQLRSALHPDAVRVPLAVAWLSPNCRGVMLCAVCAIA